MSDKNETFEDGDTGFSMNDLEELLGSGSASLADLLREAVTGQRRSKTVHVSLDDVPPGTMADVIAMLMSIDSVQNLGPEKHKFIIGNIARTAADGDKHIEKVMNFGQYIDPEKHMHDLNDVMTRFISPITAFYAQHSNEEDAVMSAVNSSDIIENAIFLGMMIMAGIVSQATPVHSEGGDPA